MIRLFCSMFVLIILTTCNYKRKADKIFYNGKIYIVDNNFSSAEAMAISRGRIRDVGDNRDILDDYAAPERIDLKGAVIFPGFIDAHCHFYGYATDLLKCDLYGTTSFDDVLTKLTAYSGTNKFAWLLGRGWDQNDWSENSFPSNSKLDSLFPDIPVFLMRIDGHAALCNSKALKLAGITAGMNIEGGECLVNDGKLTGLIIDNAINLVKKSIPPFSQDLINESLLRAQENCFAVGLTTLDDAGLGKDSIFQLIDLQKSGKLKMKIYAMFSDDSITVKYFFDHGPLKTERLTVNAVKVYADGALGSRGACLKKEYSDQKGHYGFMLHSKKYLDYIADEALNHGFQMCTHAIGDSANEMVLDVYSDHLSTENRRRWRIEHCQVVEKRDRKKFGEYSIIPSVQPTHATSDMYWVEKRLGKDRMKDAYAYEDLRDAADGMIVFGTDFPVESINPLYTFYAAVARKDLKGFPPNGFQIENDVKRKDAIRAMTIWAAYANFEDEEKGSLEDGKYADFVIMDLNIMEVAEDSIPLAKVIATYINGEKVFEQTP